MPDSQFEKQVNTIKSNKASCINSSSESSEWDLRLNNDPYYFKFCEKRKNSSRDDSLVKGINIPFSHLEKYLDFHKNSQNKRIGYQNCSRYFNNSEFITLAKGGWIGSNLGATDCIAKILSGNRESGRNSMLVIVDVPESMTTELRKVN